MSDGMAEAIIEKKGKVVAIDGEYVVIETRPHSSCSHCGSSDSCGVSVLAGLFSRSRNHVRLLNHLDLKLGDQAVIGINELVLLSTAVMAYMLPLVIMILLAVVFDIAGFSDDINFIFSLLGLFVGLFISNHIMENKGFKSREIVLLRNAC